MTPFRQVSVAAASQYDYLGVANLFELQVTGIASGDSWTIQQQLDALLSNISGLTACALTVVRGSRASPSANGYDTSFQMSCELSRYRKREE